MTAGDAVRSAAAKSSRPRRKLRPLDEDSIVVIKLGGSLLTNKRKPETARRKEIARLAEEISKARKKTGRRVILSHGSGSFGHVAAEKFRLTEGFVDPSQRVGASITQASAARLNRIIVQALIDAGESPFVLAPSSFLTARLGRPVKGDTEGLKLALSRDLLPVVYGDVLLDSDLGVSIASTEAVLTYLIGRLLKQRFPIARAYWLGDTDGVLAEDGSVIPTIQPDDLTSLRPLLGGAQGFDVTGGMRHRVETAAKLAEMGVLSWIANGTTPGLLGKALRGESIPGTRVEPDDAS